MYYVSKLRTLKKIVIIIFTFVSLYSCKHEETGEIYIISSNSNYTKQALDYSRSLCDSLVQEKQFVYFTHESMLENEIMDKQWCGIDEGKYLDLIATDDRQSDPQIKKFFDFSYSAESTKKQNEINKMFLDACKEAGLRPEVPFWKTKSADSIVAEVRKVGLSKNFFMMEKERINFLTRPNDRILDLCLKAAKEKKSVIIRYDEAHSFWLKTQLDKMGVKYNYKYIGNPMDLYGKERKYFLLSMSEAWILGEF